MDEVTACKEQKGTTEDEVELNYCCSLHSLASSMIYYSTHTHTEKYYLFVSYNKNSVGLLKDFRGMKKEEHVC